MEKSITEDGQSTIYFQQKREERERMQAKKVDDLIVTLCSYISNKAEEKDTESALEIAENTKALAALLTARAQMVTSSDWSQNQ